jgi:hypothetical protein
MGEINYGSSGAGFADTIARMRAEAAAIAELTAKEEERSAAEERDTDATQDNAAARTRTAAAVDALVDTIGRSIEVLNAETDAIRANSDAWIANAVSRGRTAGAAEAGSVAVPRGAAAGSRAAEEAPLITFPQSAEEKAAVANPEAYIQKRYGGTAGAARSAASTSTAAETDLSEVAERNSAALEQQAARQAVVNDLANQSAAAYAASSQALQRHGALTSEFFQGLAKGQVTLAEFQSQMLITLGKFSGWAVAGGLVYGAFEGVKDVLSGIEATQSGVSQLKRSLGDKVNVPEAEAGFRRVSAEVNVPIAKVAEAQFYAARAFPDQKESLSVAGTAVRAEKLDEVPVQEAVKSFGALNVEFGLSADGIKSIFDELDAGQLKFNARLNQTLPQLGRAAASFANAGGSPTQLVQQIIELNRATGGGGGQGGGNPATFLIREPGNLAKPATEQILRQHGFNAEDAQQHIGTFNEEVQKRAALPQGVKGALTKDDLKELAEAVGGGTANGLRYGLPLFASGTSGLAAEVRKGINPEAAAGSAEHDLQEKLAQLNELGHKAAITLQDVGSELATIGVGPSLTDAAKALDLLLTAGAAAIYPFVKLGEILGELPAPLRLAVEGILVYKAALLASRSGPGLAATSLAGQAGIPYIGGGAKELLALRTTQEATLKYGIDNREKLASKAQAASAAAQNAGAATARFQQSVTPEELAAGSPAERAAYQQKLADLQGREISLAEKQEQAMLAWQTQTDRNIATEKLIGDLKDKSLSAQERLVAAQQAGLYGAQAGAPNTLPFLVPGEGGARAVPGGLPVGGAAGVASVAGSEQAISGGADALARDAAVGSVAAVGIGGKLGTAANGVKGLATSLPALGSKITGFFGSLGLLGTAVAGFVGLDIVNKLAGGPKDFEQGTKALEAVQEEVTSEKNAYEKADAARKAAHKQSYFAQVTSDIVSGVQHPVQFIESQFDTGKYPGTFLSAQNASLLNKARALEKKAHEGKYSLSGQNLGGSGEEEVGFKEETEVAAEGFSANKSPEANEKQATLLAKKMKLLFDRLEAFGALGKGTGGGAEALSKLAVLQGTLGKAALTSGDEGELDAVTKFGDEATEKEEEVAEKELKRGLKFAQNASQRAAAQGAANAKLAEAYKKIITVPSEEISSTIDQREKIISSEKQNLAKIPHTIAGSKEAEVTRAKIKQQESWVGKERAALVKEKEKGEQLREKQQEAEETIGKETYSEDAAQNKAKGALGEASANKQSAAKAALNEARANTEQAEGSLKGKERRNVLPELEAAEKKAEQAVASAALSLVKSKGGRREAEVPNQEPVQTAQAALRTATEELKYIELHKKDFSAEELIDAATAMLKAKKAAAEAVSQEAQKISQFQTQLEQAHSEGNAVAQASEGLAGANRELAKAVGPEQVRQAQLNIAKEQNTLAKALQSRVTAEGELAKSVAKGPIGEAKAEVSTDKRLLALAQGPEEKEKDEATLNNAKKSQLTTLVSNREREISFQEEMQEISKQQAIQQLDELLKLHNLSQSTREELRSKIRNLEKGAANNQVFDLAPGSIKLPTAYDVHRAAGEALERGASLIPHGNAPVAVVRQTNQITVNVAHAHDVHKVGEELERVTGGAINTRLRKAGFRGN